MQSIIKRKKARVFLDTNFLMLPGRLKVDIFTQIERIVQEQMEFVVLDKVLNELQSLASEAEKGADRAAAKLAILLIKQKSLKIARSFGNKSADDVLTDKTGPGDYVATQDKELRERLRKKNVMCIGLRQKNRVMMT